MNSAVQAYHQASNHQVENLILDNLDYVRKILSTMAVNLPDHCDRENLEQAGMVGLVEAARSFDPARGVQFRTFSYTRIRGAIVDELRKNSNLSQKMLEQIAELKRAYDQLQGPVSPEQMAQHLGWPDERVSETLEAIRFTQPTDWSDLQSAADVCRDRIQDSPESDIEARELIEKMADCIGQLPERERIVLTLYYTEDLTLKEIGTIINLSESRVSRVLSSATFRLKEMIEHDLTETE